MTSAAQILRHFHDRPAGVTLDWIIEQFLASARELGALSIEIPHSEPSRLEATANGEKASDTGRPGLRLLRTVLARMAKMGADEGDVEFQPYGGHVAFQRDDARIEVDFENTTVNQRFSMIAVLTTISSGSQTGSRNPALSGAG